MRAAICYQYGEDLQIEEASLSALKQGEVRVGIAACAICQSDLHLLKGDWGGTVPVIAGHEAAGTVLETANDVTDFNLGDTVIVSLIRACGRCRFCAEGIPTACNHDAQTGSEPRLFTAEQQPIAQGIYVGAFAEETILDQSQMIKIDKDLPLEEMALLSCGVITGVGAVLNSAQVKPGSAVIVVGTGGVGINVIQGARIAGAHPIIAIDVDDSKLQMAEQLGATHLINSQKQDSHKTLAQICRDKADYAFITVGIPALMSQALDMVHAAGKVVITGMPAADHVRVEMDAFLITAGRTIIGSKMGSANIKRDIPQLIEFYRQGKLQLKPLITERYPLDEINHAIALMQQGKALRNLVMMG